MSDSVGTQNLLDIVCQCDDLEELRENILPLLESAREHWKKKINEILKESGYTKEHFSNLCGISRVTLDKWLDGALPQSRERYIRIGFAAGYNLEQMNQFLQQYGKYSELYPRHSLEDSVYIFVLTSNMVERSFQKCEEILLEVEKEFAHKNKEEHSDLYDTSGMLKSLEELQTEEQLKYFVSKAKTSYEERYEKLYRYIHSFIRKNCGCEGVNQPIKASAFVAGFRSSIQKHLQAILRKRWIPLRRQVIEIGVSLNMNLEQINKMLNLAKMAPLYARNPMECVIIFALTDAELNNMIVPDGREDLYDYVSSVLESVHMSWNDM